MWRYQAEKSPVMSLNGIRKEIFGFQRHSQKTTPKMFMEFTGITSEILFYLTINLKSHYANLQE